MEEKEISQAVIGRLPRYFRYLGELKDEGVERISSQDLSTLMKVTASQIRQDLNNFGGFGQQGYGYNVEYLYEAIGKILGLDKQHKFVIIGAGNLGRALGNYLNFERRGFIFRGMFDQNPNLVGDRVRGVSVMPMEELERFIEDNDIDIAVLTIPKTSAVPVAERLARTDIRAIWNFAHVDLNLPERIQVENVHLSDSLMKLSYNISRYQMECVSAMEEAHPIEAHFMEENQPMEEEHSMEEKQSTEEQSMEEHPTEEAHSVEESRE